MYIKQISVFVENTVGRLSEFTKVLKENNINMQALCIADTVDFGILRCIVDEPEKATKVLTEGGFTASITEVLAVEMEDNPGGLHSILEILNKEHIAIDYVYSVIRSRENNSIIVIKVANPKDAVKALEKANVKLYCQKELTQ